MHDLPFQELSTILDEELQRQEELLALVREQGGAIVKRDATTLETHTNAINTLVGKAAAAESARHAVLREIVDHLELPVSEQTMSHIAEDAPAPYRDRLEFQQARLHTVMTECHELIYENARRLRRAAQITNDCLLVMTGQAEAPSPAYSSGGSASDAAPRPNVVNQRG